MRKQGFTLIETMVAISVLLIAVVAPMTLAQDGITAARLAQDQIVAFYMAQEGVELVRNIRDENKLAGIDQLSGNLVACKADPNNVNDRGCYIDATQISGGSFLVNDCASSGCPIMRSNDDIYTYRSTSSYQDTKYTRQIKAWYVQDPIRTEVRVEVSVTWPFQNATRSYILYENLLSW